MLSQLSYQTINKNKMKKFRINAVTNVAAGWSIYHRYCVFSQMVAVLSIRLSIHDPLSCLYPNTFIVLLKKILFSLKCQYPSARLSTAFQIFFFF